MKLERNNMSPQQREKEIEEKAQEIFSRIACSDFATNNLIVDVDVVSEVLAEMLLRIEKLEGNPPEPQEDK